MASEGFVRVWFDEAPIRFLRDSPASFLVAKKTLAVSAFAAQKEFLFPPVGEQKSPSLPSN